MKATVVYGCPCSGKSTYVRSNAAPNDIIYDFDALLRAVTTITIHTPNKCAARRPVYKLRRQLVYACRNETEIDTFWMLCRWPTEDMLDDLSGIETEFHLVEATKEECLQRLHADESRPDKEAWEKIITDWFDKHGAETYVPKSLGFDSKRASDALALEKLRFGGWPK